MPTKKLLLKNSVFIFISYVVTAIAQTFVYIYASKILGNELFGVWSFLYSGALVVGLSNIGLPNLIITYTSKFLAEKNYFKLYQYLIHSIIIFFISFPIVLSIALFIFYFGIKGLKIQSLSNTTFLLFSVLFFLQNLTNILLAFVDGLQKTYIRAIIQLISNIFFFIASWILIHQGNINSIVNCQIILYIIQVTSAIFFILKFWKLSPTTKSTNRLFSFDIIKEIFRKSINYFFISISTIFFEPLSRYLIGKYLGIGTIAYYEITSRIIGGFYFLL
ncbi:MAG: oligosaccharide flippase family protein [Bacteroidetes bacterium]|nr:oligosaccharide flippase family protein [Bacteroidota bacterium]